ncbi:hypothetical protein D3C73_963110 [compost metagenome]
MRALHPARRATHPRQILPMIGLAPVLLLPARAVHRSKTDLGLHQVAAVGGIDRHLTMLAGVAAGHAVRIVAIETHGRIFPPAAVQAQAQGDRAGRSLLQRRSVGLQQTLQRCMTTATHSVEQAAHVPRMLHLTAIPGGMQPPDPFAPARLFGHLCTVLPDSKAQVQRLLVMQAAQPWAIGQARPVRPDLRIQIAPVGQVASGGGMGFRLGSQQQCLGALQFAIVIGLGQPMRPVRRERRRQCLPDLRGQLDVILDGDRQQRAPVLLQHLRRLVAGELQHAGQQLTALAVTIAPPGIDTDRRDSFIRQQIQRRIEEGGAGRAALQRLQQQRAKPGAVFAGQGQQHAQAVIACARRIVRIEDGGDGVAHAGLLAGEA